MHKVYMHWPEIYSCNVDALSRPPHLRSGVLYGVCSSIGRVPGCDSGGSGIVTHHSPKYALVVELVDTAVLEAVALRLRVRVSPEVQLPT